MDKERKHIDVKISIESVAENLRKLINSGHSQLITKTIINNLMTTDVGLEQLYKAINGIEDKLRFKIGDKVRIELDSLSTWNFDKKKTAESDYVFQGRMLGVITEIFPCKKYAYNISYTAIEVGGEPKELNTAALEGNLYLDEEWPEIVKEKENDLPF